MINQAILLIAVLIALGTAPVNMIIDFLFDDIIAAPLEEEYEFQLLSRRVRQRVGRNVSRADSFTINTISEVSPVTNTASVPRKQKLSLARRMASSVMAHFTVPNASARRLPPAIVQANASATMILSDIFGHQAASEAVLQSSSLNQNTDLTLCDDDEERCQLNDWSVNSLASFEALFLEQYDLLVGDAKKEFEDRWGIKVNSGGSSDTDGQSNPLGYDQAVAAETTSKLKTFFRCLQRRVVPRKVTLSAAIDETTDVSLEKIKKLKMASDAQVGLEIMHYFIIDLLGYVTRVCFIVFLG